MNIKTKIAALVLATLPLQGMGYVAYAQSTGVDQQFMRNLEAALREKPELILEAAARAQQKQREVETARMNETAGEVRKQVAVNDNPGYVIGNPNGKLTYVEYLDYRCGYCKRAHGEVNKLIAGNPEVRVVVVQLPVLGPQSETLARFAMAASNQGKFKKAHDYLYDNTVEPTEEGLKAAANAIGLDWAKIQSDMTSQAITTRLERNRKLAEIMNVNGTPFFITPKTVIPGATTADVLESAA